MSKESPLASQIWTQRNLGIDLLQNLEDINTNDIVYLCDTNYPFIQVINPNATFSEETSIEFVVANTPTSAQWVIHIYGNNAISTSAPQQTNTKTEGNASEQKE